ncbi:uncharacterized protein BO88DRAFT_486637 [Aspergillus vadensis CBS 113365]|uniref:Uncharacterized protein n=1 Tax=Aspergillus vadensis (strain CBS 113365 / IMI 142717 / IBT 24658) TaxID=1448311 RepID=A0A319BK46_ASPVC|nr:hypothetical protein BO88DRAFT_486637 [Aspergillus vadensis CBS 113365]PYH71340.1 hypothetical protein BO88DRAFT_486637 [Aspergillus vadensis CBS 113365]
MEIGLFGPNLYCVESGDETRKQVVSSILEIPGLRESWVPSVGPQLIHPENPIGCYDTHMRSVIKEEGLAWTRILKDFSNIVRPVKAPPRAGLIPRGRVHLRSMAEAYDVPDTPVWHAIAEVIYGYSWCLVDNNIFCNDCLRGTGTCAILASFPDYYHFCQDMYPVLEMSAQRLVEYIAHVDRCHPHGGEHQKVMDAWVATAQSTYLDILHPKAEKMKGPEDELQSIRYRLINSAARALTLEARLEQGSLIGDDNTIDAVAIAKLCMHDGCDYRHDNAANEFYNIITIVGSHRGVPANNMFRRFCIDVWAWAVDNEADWAIYIAGRVLAWQVYMERYRTPILFDNLVHHDANNQPTDDFYGDPFLNSMNPLPPSSHPHDFDLRNRCRNKDRYDELLRNCLAHFEACPGCHEYDKKTSWADRVPLLGKAYETKYTDCSCLNFISTYMILACMDPVWWAMDYAAEYTGPMEKWSPLLC